MKLPLRVCSAITQALWTRLSRAAVWGDMLKVVSQPHFQGWHVWSGSRSGWARGHASWQLSQEHCTGSEDMPWEAKVITTEYPILHYSSTDPSLIQVSVKSTEQKIFSIELISFSIMLHLSLCLGHNGTCVITEGL